MVAKRFSPKKVVAKKFATKKVVAKKVAPKKVAAKKVTTTEVVKKKAAQKKDFEKESAPSNSAYPYLASGASTIQLNIASSGKPLPKRLHHTKLCRPSSSN